MRKRVCTYDLTGKKYGRLTVLFRIQSQKQGAMWLCACDCGITVEVLGRNLRRDDTKSCGCYQREMLRRRAWKHGLSNTTIRRRWTSIKQRVSNPKNPSFKNYGGRGISMHLPWMLSLECFARELPPKPDGNVTIDRINNDGNYEPGNIRWATKAQQCRNKRVNHWITVDGTTKILTDWATFLGVFPAAIYEAMKEFGQTDEEAVRYLMTRKGIAV